MPGINPNIIINVPCDPLLDHRIQYVHPITAGLLTIAVPRTLLIRFRIMMRQIRNLCVQLKHSQALMPFSPGTPTQSLKRTPSGEFARHRLFSPCGETRSNLSAINLTMGKTHTVAQSVVRVGNPSTNISPNFWQALKIRRAIAQISPPLPAGLRA